jgi:hypothetical protein
MHIVLLPRVQVMVVGYPLADARELRRALDRDQEFCVRAGQIIARCVLAGDLLMEGGRTDHHRRLASTVARHDTADHYLELDHVTLS